MEGFVLQLFVSVHAFRSLIIFLLLPGNASSHWWPFSGTNQPTTHTIQLAHQSAYRCPLCAGEDGLTRTELNWTDASWRLLTASSIKIMKFQIFCFLPNQYGKDLPLQKQVYKPQRWSGQMIEIWEMPWKNQEMTNWSARIHKRLMGVLISFSQTLGRS